MKNIKIKSIFLFILLFACVSYSLASGFLFGVAPAVYSFLQANDYAESAQNIYLKIAMLLYTLISFLFSFWLTRKLLVLKIKSITNFSIIMCILCAACSFTFMLNPNLFSEQPAKEKTTLKNKINSSNHDVKNAIQNKITEISMPQSFERGEVIRIDQSVYIMPFPTNDEFYRYILNKKFKTIISFLDPRIKDEISWIEKEKKLCEQYNINLIGIPLNPENPARQQINFAVETVKKSEKPVAIHGFLMNSQREKEFINFFSTNSAGLKTADNYQKNDFTFSKKQADSSNKNSIVSQYYSDSSQLDNKFSYTGQIEPSDLNIPDLRLIILFLPFAIIISVSSAAFTGFLKRRYTLATAYSRKIFHFIIFTAACFIHITMGYASVLIFGIVTATIIFYVTVAAENFWFYKALARESDKPEEKMFILIPLLCTAAGGFLSNLLFDKFAIIGYLVCGWGDAIAEPVGRKFGKHFYKVPSIFNVKSQRSYEGSAAVLIAGFLGAFAGFMFIGFNINSSLMMAAACAAAGTIIEAFSSHGIDNFTIQLGVSALAYFLYDFF